MASNRKSPMTPLGTEPSRILKTRMIQNFHLVWLDASIDESNDDVYRNTIAQFRQVVNTVNTFIDADECIDFVTDFNNEKAIVVISDTFSENVISIIHDILQVSSIFVFCRHTTSYKQWTQLWPTLYGAYTDITPMCEALKTVAYCCEQNSVSISFIKPTAPVFNQSFDTLDCSFMYTQILKDILLTTDFESQNFTDFLSYYREQVVDNPVEVNVVEEIRREYRNYSPIWWYTKNVFLYSMFNKALRLMEVDPIIKMGFFVHDLHKHITKLHSEQYGGQHHSKSFTVYRGQGLSQIDFGQLKRTQGGLLAFNNFLSTSVNEAISFTFAESNLSNPDCMGVLFVITIDSSVSSSPFANVKSISCYHGEEEILFSMHSVFRIGEVKQIEKNDRLWQVELTLTTDNDQQLHILTETMRNEIQELTGWCRLGKLLMIMGEFGKAKEVYEILLQQTTNEEEKASLYHQLGAIRYKQGNYPEAVEYCKKSIAINGKILHPNNRILCNSYNDIGLAYHEMREYSKALSCYEKALEMQQKTLCSNHPSLTISYSNIGSIYASMGQYSKALSYYERALEIQQKMLPENHPLLATSYNNIGGMYDCMGAYSKALSYYNQASKIQQKVLPANHPSLAVSYGNIGRLYAAIGEYSEALSHHEKALEIQQKSLPANHPLLVTSYNNIGSVYEDVGEHLRALSYYIKASKIEQTSLPTDQPSLATSYNNIGLVYHNIGECPKALSYHEKALEIRQKNLPETYSDLAASYGNIGMVYNTMGEYSKALSYYEKALEIQQKTLPANHPLLATSYNNIGSVYHNMEEYSKALLYMGDALDMFQRSLPPTHPYIQAVKESIGIIKKKLEKTF